MTTLVEEIYGSEIDLKEGKMAPSFIAGNSFLEKPVFVIRSENYFWNDNKGYLTKRSNSRTFLVPTVEGFKSMTVYNSGYGDSPKGSFGFDFRDGDSWTSEDRIANFKYFGNLSLSSFRSKPRLDNSLAFKSVPEKGVTTILDHMGPGKLGADYDEKNSIFFIKDYDGKRPYAKTDTVTLFKDAGWVNLEDLGVALNYEMIKKHCEAMSDESIVYTWYGPGNRTAAIRNRYKHNYESFFEGTSESCDSIKRYALMQENFSVFQLKQMLEIMGENKEEILSKQVSGWGMFG